jgi:hypothetical protein
MVYTGVQVLAALTVASTLFRVVRPCSSEEHIASIFRVEK